MKKGQRRLDVCTNCGKNYYKYRNNLKYCSRKCFGEKKRLKEDESYIIKIKDKIKINTDIKENGCWNFLKNQDKIGRGRLWFRNTTVVASRVSYILFIGEIPITHYVCHKCDNPSCVNPDHLFLGTPKENMCDKDDKKRTARGEKIGNSKMKSEMIKEVKNMRKNGISQQKIADKYGVSQVSISRILNGKTWKHV